MGTGQYVVGLRITMILLTPVLKVPPYFGCLLEAGFPGGRGYALIIKAPPKIRVEADRVLIPEAKRLAGSFISITHDSLEPFAFDAAFVRLAILIGWFLLSVIKSVSAGMKPDLFRSFPLFPLA